jgi:hypothetical protein
MKEVHDTAQVDKAEVVCAMVFVAHQHAPKVLQPGEQPFHFPPAFVASQRASIPGLGRFPLGPMRRNQFHPLFGQVRIERVAIVSFVPDHMFMLSIDNTRGESRFTKGDFVRRSTRNMDGDRKASAVYHGHDLCTFAPLGRSHPAPPFFATTRVPSMKHSDRSSPPHS